MVTKLHLDTDIGGDIDDLCALAYLLKRPDVEVTGVTTVAEDKGRRAGYAKYVLDLLGQNDIPVASGADVSGGYYRFRPGYPDETVMWPEPIKPFRTASAEAFRLLRKSIQQGAIIVGIGPYTNLALLDQKFSGILSSAKVYLMGGNVYPAREGFPKTQNEWDWNVQMDINSAKYVFSNSRPTLIPINITVETALRRSHFPKLKKSGPIGKILAKQATEWATSPYWDAKMYSPDKDQVPNDILNFLHDPLTCGIALGWNEGVQREGVSLSTQTKNGYLITKPSANGTDLDIITRVNGPKFNQHWLDVVTS